MTDESKFEINTELTLATDVVNNPTLDDELFSDVPGETLLDFYIASVALHNQKNNESSDNLNSQEKIEIDEVNGKGIYTSPRRIDICGIDTLIVDPHNEALFQWFKVKRGGILVHVDDHSDMNDQAPLPPENFDRLTEYIADELSISDFIATAVHLGVIDTVYHLIPKARKIHAYGQCKMNRNGEMIREVRTRLDNSNNIVWDTGSYEWKSLGCESITVEQFLTEVNLCRKPMVGDIDLDAYLGFTGCCFYWEKPPTQEPRIAWTMDVLRKMKKPDVITIARSQTPTAYAPPIFIDSLEAEVVAKLRKAYSRNEYTVHGNVR